MLVITASTSHGSSNEYPSKSWQKWFIYLQIPIFCISLVNKREVDHKYLLRRCFFPLPYLHNCLNTSACWWRQIWKNSTKPSCVRVRIHYAGHMQYVQLVMNLKTLLKTVIVNIYLSIIYASITLRIRGRSLHDGRGESNNTIQDRRPRVFRLQIL